MVIYDGQMDRTPYKNIVGAEMEAIAKADADVVYLDADLMSSMGTYKFWKSNPRQAINCGVAEANMIGIAGGLSAGGKKPYVHSFGPFASRRCYDQVFLSIAYAGNSARIFGTDPGVTAAFNGGTHMPFEDIALYRAIPGATVIEISDGAMLKSLMWQLKEHKGLTYIRTTRKGYPAVYSDDHPLQIGKGEVLREGTDVTIIACGLMVGEAMKAASMLAGEGVSARVIDMFTIKPIDCELVCKAAQETGKIVTAENHSVIGGLGDAVANALIECGRFVPIKKVGVQDQFGSVGPQEYLQEYYGLTAAKIVETVKSL